MNNSIRDIKMKKLKDNKLEILILSLLLSVGISINPLPAQAAYGPSGAVVNSPAVVKSLTLEEVR